MGTGDPVSGTAMWFVPVADPDAYGATFASKPARLAVNDAPAVAQDSLLDDVDPAYLLDYQSGLR